MDRIETELESARKKLLDFTMRNRLLNYRPTRMKTIQTADEIPRAVYEKLVVEGKTMEFLARPETEAPVDGQSAADGPDQEDTELSEAEQRELWALPEEDTSRVDRQNDRYLDTNLDAESLQKKLFQVSQQAQSVIEEQGYNALFLALGFLEWREADQADKLRKAPLLLVPVEIERYKSRSSFKLKWTEEDIQYNISLQGKLADQGVRLPEFEGDGTNVDEIAQYFSLVKKTIGQFKEWSVIDDVVLDFFSFTKFVMYKDLDPEAWPEGMSPGKHGLIRTLLGDDQGEQQGEGFLEGDIDKKLKSQDVYHVMDADPSQIAVIEDVKSGRNLVVEGPPGTGKSQTITNVISELLVSGKNVLFVSEKMAALEVVKSRLDHCGLGDFCLELHSRKARKKEVLQEIERTLSTMKPGAVSVEQKMQRLEQLKAELNQYAEALQTPFGNYGKTPFYLFYTKEKALQHFDKVGRSLMRFQFEDIENLSDTQVQEAEKHLHSLTEMLAIVEPIQEHPWWGCDPGTVLPADEPLFESLIQTCSESLNRVFEVVDDVCKRFALRRPTTVYELGQAIDALEVLAVAPHVEADLLTDSAWDRANPKAEKLTQTLQKFQAERHETFDRFSERVLDQELDLWLKDYRELSIKFFRFFYSRYRQLKQEIQSLYHVPEKDRSQIVRHLEQALGVQKLREELKDESPDGRSLFGSFWRDEESDPQELKSFSEWIVPFRKALGEEVFLDGVIPLISKGEAGQEAQGSLDLLKTSWAEFGQAWESVCEKVGADKDVVLGSPFGQILLRDLQAKVACWQENLPSIQRWSQFVSVCKIVDETVAKPILQLVQRGEIVAVDLQHCFRANVADELLRLVLAERSELANFVGEIHENKIKEFADLDRELIGWNSHRLLDTLFDKRPKISGGASSGSESGILLGEMNRKRGHMPIRKLMSRVGGLIQKIKPCFMMSPLSIAQFLDPKTAKFDVIVFDEASQVKPEDALGAILRGNQLVVMGDTRQLPPTSFFDNIIDSDMEEDEDDHGPGLVDVESILAQCKRSFPSKSLNWHYRSRHESLIAVSNQEFYDNRMLIYPSSSDRVDHLGLEFVHVPDGIYDRGKSASNRIEARYVAQAAVEHFRNHPSKSLGVGTFNLKQQQTILEEIELQRRKSPDVDELFSSGREQHFFVKNLETIQGDERDVIFLSVGYGFDTHKRLNRNFGPLNQEGGERRLNVLITRARERCVVFSNFRASDLSLDGSASIGLRAFKIFLDYAETRNLVASEAVGRDTDSPFEDSVYEFLRDNRYEVRPQVGCAGFRVDLGVVDAREPGRYLMGVECDGAKYHSSPVARDRDRLRQQILEGLGWQIYRIWSTDWYRNRRDSQDRLLRALEEAKLRVPVLHIRKTKENDVPPPEVKTTTLDHAVSEGALGNIAPEYRICTRISISTKGAIHEINLFDLAKAVEEIVKIEGPVHIDEVVRRIRILWGVKRAGTRIQRAIEGGINTALVKRLVIGKGKFLWNLNQQVENARRRTGDPAPNLDFICQEEIKAAILMVLKHQYASPENELASQTARVLGFSRVTESTASYILKVIQEMLKKGDLEMQANGNVQVVR